MRSPRSSRRRGPRRGSVRAGAVARRPAASTQGSPTRDRRRPTSAPGIFPRPSACCSTPRTSSGRRSSYILDVGRRQLGDQRGAHGTHAEHADYLDPTDTCSTQLPTVPALNAGENKLPEFSKNNEGYDDFTLYLMARGPPGCAHCVARGRCVRGRIGRWPTAAPGPRASAAAVTGVTPAAGAVSGEGDCALARRMPDAGVDSTGSEIVFRLVRSGRRVVTPPAAVIKEATTLAAGRNNIAIDLAGRNVPNGVATCVARLLMDRPLLRRASRTPHSVPRPRPRFAACVVTGGPACRLNPRVGIP